MSNLHLQPDKGGPWPPDVHEVITIGADCVEREALSEVIRRYEPKTMIDFGCGPGLYVQHACSLGVNAWGVEPFPFNGQFRAEGRQIIADLSDPLDLGCKWDLVLCLEVLEHIPAEFTDTVLDNLERATGDLLLFSAGSPNESGLGHVNTRWPGEWVTLLSERGFHWLPSVSLELRDMCRWPWFRTHLSLYAKGE